MKSAETICFSTDYFTDDTDKHFDGYSIVRNMACCVACGGTHRCICTCGMDPYKRDEKKAVQKQYGNQYDAFGGHVIDTAASLWLFHDYGAGNYSYVCSAVCVLFRFDRSHDG